MKTSSTRAARRGIARSSFGAAAAFALVGLWSGSSWAERIRVMAANITSGDAQSYDPGEGIRIFRGVKPDIVLIQEMNYRSNSPEALRRLVDAAFGPEFSYYREDGDGIPNGIISRFPIVDAGEWDDASAPDRDFAWAHIDIPGPRDLWAVSVHLLTRDHGVRVIEAQQLVAYLMTNAAPDDYIIIGGDFNSDTRQDPLFRVLRAVVETRGPYPAAEDGNDNTNASRSKPYDGIYASPELSALETPVVIGDGSFPGGLVVDTRAYSRLIDIAPARRYDSGARNMQHMAVLKDFDVPGDGQ